MQHWKIANAINISTSSSPNQFPLATLRSCCTNEFCNRNAKKETNLSAAGKGHGCMS